jgi:hypothetical protein
MPPTLTAASVAEIFVQVWTNGHGSYAGRPTPNYNLYEHNIR